MGLGVGVGVRARVRVGVGVRGRGRVVGVEGWGRVQVATKTMPTLKEAVMWKSNRK